jgi:hypothetical protein
MRLTISGFPFTSFFKSDDCHLLMQVDNFHDKDEIYYEEDPHTSFQRFVRLPKKGNLLPSNQVFSLQLC